MTAQMGEKFFPCKNSIYSTWEFVRDWDGIIAQIDCRYVSAVDCLDYYHGGVTFGDVVQAIDDYLEKEAADE